MALRTMGEAKGMDYLRALSKQNIASLSVSARQVLDVPLPVDADAWREGAARLRAAEPGDLAALVGAGGVLTAAHGLSGADAERVVDGWAARLPGRSVS